MTDESWTDILTIFFVVCVALALWWLVAGCHAHFHLKDIHYHGVEPPAEVVIEVPTGEEP